MTYSIQYAPYACLPSNAGGRFFQEDEDAQRSPFQRDRDRIIHSIAFRRLEYKTQVFVNHEGDHFRTRLTHSLEVAQIARSVSRALQLNEDLAETLALAHDLGHPPFGHAGEDALDEEMKDYGGFDHNDQTFRILTKLEDRYAAFEGLNLTRETLEGVVKHNGPLRDDVPASIAAFDKEHGLNLQQFGSLEAQVAAISDDIAYNNHDIDDGLRAGLFTLSDIAQVDLIGSTLDEVVGQYTSLTEGQLIHELVRRTIGTTVNDILQETGRRLQEYKIKDAEAVKSADRCMVDFSPEMQRQQDEIRAFLRTHMYRHRRVNIMCGKGRRLLSEVFRAFVENPSYLPQSWQEKITDVNNMNERVRTVADYVAGMTDRYAMQQHQKLFNIYETT